ncbi:MAG: DUF2891 domain-containing protein [Woeseiaceae bacterium]
MRFAEHRFLFILFFALLSACTSGDRGDDAAPVPIAEHDFTLTAESASRFAALALDCMHREYPNKLNQVLKDESGLLPPETLHPAFYGCFDWHSSVHGHWMLVKLLKEFPDLPERSKIISGITQSLTAENVAGELRYFKTASASWERTYGWAWLLQLATELQQWDDPLGQRWADALAPLAQLIRDRYIEFLPRQEYPVRTGVHPNTAFGLSFAYDYAESILDNTLKDAVVSAATRYFSADSDCPLAWEPSGEDFLSPCFEEAALMARVLPEATFKTWLDAFLPTLSDPGSLTPANVSDRADPKIVHLDGLNLSRAWDLYVIADHVSKRSSKHSSEQSSNERDDALFASQLRVTAASHLAATLPHVTSEHYEGSHWLGSFAIYALTRND